MSARGAIALAVVLAACAPRVASAQTRYTVTLVGPLPGDFGSFATGLDEAGTVCAWSDTTDGMVWSNGRLAALPALPGGATTRAEGLGPLGSVVGSSQTAAFEHAVLWERVGAGFVARDLGVAPGDVQSLAFATNGRLVVGLTDDAIVWRPCAWRRLAPGGAAFNVEPLPLLPGDFGGEAHDVDARGRVVGSSAAFGSSRAVLWDAAAGTWTVQELPPLAPGASCEARALNERGLIVGWCVSPATGVEHAVAWRNGAVVDLGAPAPGWRALALDVNERGDVVGKAGPFAYTSGWVRPSGASSAVLLDTLLPTDSPWTIASAEDVDESGRIAATGILGGFFQTCLLTPVEIDLVGPAAGSAGSTATLVAVGAAPGALVRFHVGTGGGASPLAGCPAGNLDIAGALPLGAALADAGGVAQLSVALPARLSGATLWFQASEAGSCRVTDVERVGL